MRWGAGFGAPRVRYPVRPMQYRSFPKFPDLRISSLGFGAMRLPIVGGESARIDEEAATALVHDAIRQGVFGIWTGTEELPRTPRGPSSSESRPLSLVYGKLSRNR